MLQKLSYFNIMLAVIYVFVYLKDGTLNSTVGLIMIIVFSWLALRSYHLDNYRWGIWHYLTGLWSLYYIGFIMYGVGNITIASIEYDFVSPDTITLLTLSTVLSIGVALHFVLYFTRNYRVAKNNGI